MATNESPRSRSASDTFVNVLLVGVLAVVGWLAWPSLVGQFQARTGIAPLAAPPAPPTAVIRPAAPVFSSAPRPADVQVAPAIPGVAQNEATAQSQYDAAVRAAEQTVPNADNTNDSAPLQYISKPAPERQPAADIVATAEPIAPAESNDQFGSRPAAPINVQESHTCLHGQVWTESGCHRPTPTQ